MNKNKKQENKKSKFKPRWLFVIILIVVTFGVYFNSLENGFVWDDKPIIVENNFIKNFNNIDKIFTSDYFSLAQEKTYRPILTFSFFVNYAISELNPRGWHFVNILIHVVNVLLIYGVLSLLIKDKQTVYLSTFLFSVHPILTEAVNCISFREDLLAGTFLWGAFYAFLKGDFNSKYKNILFIFSTILFILGLFTKEIVVIFPFVVMLYFLLIKNLNIKKIITTKYRGRNFIFSSIIFLIIYLVFTFLIFKPEGIVAGLDVTRKFPYPGGSFLRAVFIMSKVFLTYLFLIIFPYNLTPIYSFKQFTISKIISFGTLYPFLVTLFLLIGLIILTIKNKKKSFFAYFFVMGLIPVSNLIISIGAIMAERYLYIPSIGLFVLMGFFFRKILETSKNKKAKIIVLIFLFLIYLSLSIRTFYRNKDWRNSETLWTSAAKVTPHLSQPYYSLGVFYSNKGKVDEAIKAYKKALQKDPNYSRAMINLGVIYYKKHQFEKAHDYFKKATKYEYRTDVAYNYIGVVYAIKNEYKNSQEAFEKAIEINPHNEDIFINYSALYLRSKEHEKAIEILQNGLLYNKNSKKLHSKLKDVRKYLSK